jgi:DNA (cytosine-5)-methyltransferase 1
VFVVASARADFDPAAVLFEFDGVRRDIAPSRKAGETVAPTIAGCANGGGANGPGRDVDSAESLQPYAVGNTLTARMHKGMNSTLDEGQTPVVAFHPTQDPISSSDGTTHAMGCGSSGGMATIAVAQPLNIYGGNKRQDRPEGGFYVRMDEETSKTLDAATGLNPTCSQGGTAVMQPVGFDSYNQAVTGDVSKTLDVGQDYNHVPNVFQPIPLDLRNSGRDPEKHDEMNRQGVGVGEPGDPAHTVTSAFVHGVAQPMAWSIMPQNSGKDYKARQVDVLQPLMAGGVQHGNQGGDIIQTAMQVRRLTPVECERLQGFPDGYTAIPWRKKPATECPDGPRYKALGNSWAVPVVSWIGKRIQEAIE